MKKTTVISLGGSIIVPDDIDTSFMKSFVSSISDYLKGNLDSYLIIVCGGGSIARKYQQSFKEINSFYTENQADWIGIRATHLNAELINSLFSPLSCDFVVTDPTSENIVFNKQVLVSGGWKPGFSTDTDAVLLAKRYEADLIINLSNIKKVYTDDPKTNSEAKPLDKIKWVDFLKITGTVWVPGKNTPFDPVASKLAMESNLKVICADGRDIDNTLNILNNRKYVGTFIY